MTKRLLVALTVFLLGCGVVAFLVGLLWDRYSWQTGVISMAAFWVVAISLATFLAGGGTDR
jgi:uncharacterized protein with PQ loop repeat